MFVDSDHWLDEKACEDAYNEITKHSADCLMFSYTKEFGNLVKNLLVPKMVI